MTLSRMQRNNDFGNYGMPFFYSGYNNHNETPEQEQRGGEHNLQKTNYEKIDEDDFDIIDETTHDFFLKKVASVEKPKHNLTKRKKTE